MKTNTARVTKIQANSNGKPQIYEIFRENNEEAVDVDDNKILEKYMDKIDQDKRDQEQRLSNNMQSMEDRLFEDRKLMEQRIIEERRLSEERMEDKFNKAMESIEKTNEKVDKSIDRIEDKFEKLVDEVKDNNKYIRSISIATILGVAAMVVTIIIALIVAIKFK